MAERFVDTAEPQWEALINGLKSGTELNSGSVTEVKLATGSVTEAKIGEKAVSTAKLEAPKATAAFGGGKGEQVQNVTTPVRKIIVSLNAKETEKVYKIKHDLASTFVFVSVYKQSTGALMKLAKVVGESATVVEIEIEATIADKEQFFVVVAA